jgi:hypothetical protein
MGQTKTTGFMSDQIIPSEALEGLMKKAFTEGAFSPGLFWDALLNSNLYVPVTDDIEDEVEAGAGKSDDIPILLGVDADGRQVIWLFTSPKAMFEYTEQELTFREVLAPRLFASLIETKYQVVLIGPEALTLSLHPELIRSLAERKVPDVTEDDVRHVPKDAQVFVGKPTEDISQLEKKLATLFSNMENVVEGCFIQISYDGAPRLLLGLKLVQESKDHLRVVAEAVAKASEGILERGKEMDITLMNLSLKNAFAKWGVSFYKR